MSLGFKKKSAGGVEYLTGGQAEIDKDGNIRMPEDADDYYTASSSEPPGRFFFGNPDDARRFGLENDQLIRGNGLKDTIKAFDMLAKGFDPRTGAPLVQNAGQVGRVAFTDNTFSSDKTVSLAWGIADENLRQKIQDAHDLAVEDALRLLSDKATITRRGKDGKIVEQSAAIIGRFSHGSSREGDMQLHEHAAVLNLAVRGDGTTGATENHAMFVWQGAMAATYHCSLGRRLRDIGLQVETNGGNIKIAGISWQLEERFSKRTRQIDEAVAEKAAEMGVPTQAIYDNKGLFEKIKITTRREKDPNLTREQLHEAWAQEAKEHFDFTAKDVAELVGGMPHGPLIESVRDELLEGIEDRLTQARATVTEAQIYSRVAQDLMGHATLEEIEVAVAVVKEKLLMSFDEYGKVVYTTEEMMALEAQMVQSASEKVDPVFTTERAEAIVAERPSMSGEQAEAVRRILSSTSRVAVMQGAAGAGKTFSMETVAKAYQSQGYRIEAIAQNWTAAANLRTEAKLESHRAIAAWLRDLANGQIPLTDKTVVVLDEAGLVGTRDMARIVDEVEKAGTRLILTGEEKQLTSIDAGDALRVITDVVVDARIDTIRRQHDLKDRAAIKDLFERNPHTALSHWKDRIHIGESTLDANQKMFAAWAGSAEGHPGKSHLMIARENADVATLNRWAHARLAELGRLTGDPLIVRAVDSADATKGSKVTAEQALSAAAISFRVGDEVQIRVNRKELDVYNRTRATISAIDHQAGKITLHVGHGDKAREVIVGVNDKAWVKNGWLQLQHAYALTSFSSQGQTVDRVFARDSTKTDYRDWGVTCSRHREHIEIFASRAEHLAWRNDNGIDWARALTDYQVREQMSKTWSKNKHKTSTLDYIDYIRTGGWKNSAGEFVELLNIKVKRLSERLIAKAESLANAKFNLTIEEAVLLRRRENEAKIQAALQKIAADKEAALLARRPHARQVAQARQAAEAAKAAGPKAVASPTPAVPTSLPASQAGEQPVQATVAEQKTLASQQAAAQEQAYLAQLEQERLEQEEREHDRPRPRGG